MLTPSPSSRGVALALLGICAVAALPMRSHAAPPRTVTVTNLVSDIPGVALKTDARLANPWGIAFSPTGPFWVADNHTGLSTIYDTRGQIQSLVVTVPGSAGGDGAPTGTVFNNTSSFHGDLFLFVGEDGIISGWKSGTAAVIEVDNSGDEANYKGVAIGRNSTGRFLYAANFHAQTVDAFDSNFAPATLTGDFTDPDAPADYAPFNIASIDNKLYVTFAKKESPDAEDDEKGPGNGFIDIFDTDGRFVRRFASGSDVDPNGLDELNSPWGMTIAPANFSRSNLRTLLVGNFGSGEIAAFNARNGRFLGLLMNTKGEPIAIDGLWALTTGNGKQGGSRNRVYFTAGLLDEEHGLFGSIQAR